MVSFLAALVATGAVYGAALGLLGVGGGLVLPPLLYHVFDLFGAGPAAAASAVGGAAAISAILSARAARAQASRGVFDKALLRAWAPSAAAGAALGAALALLIGDQALLGVLGLLVFCGAMALAFDVKAPAGGRAAIDEAARVLATAMVAAGAGLGAGAPGRVALAAAMARRKESSTEAAVDLAAATAAIGAAAGAIAAILFMAFGQQPDAPPFSLGAVNIAALAVVTPVAAAAAPYGALIARHVAPSAVRLSAAFLLAVTGLSLLRSAGLS